MNILALDCASKTGWSIWNDGKLLESGMQDFTKRRGESNGMMFLKFRRWLSGMVKDGGINLIAYELAHHRGGAATEICTNLTGRAQEIAEEHAISFTSYHTGTIKKRATGSGSAGKPEMIQAAEKIKGSKVIDDNEADAILIGKVASEEV